ncbi:MAG: tyrosine-type recombinase/integrase [Acidobacteria bacterium]|jgi:integrase|nr:tyrosine-type recombinase/integrase [Acidobacteriota bacterium]
MLMQAVQAYVDVRRAAGFALHHTERMLRDFARCAAAQGETHIRTTTAIAWASRASSRYQRDRRLKQVIRFARHVRAEDATHQLPPDHVFSGPHVSRLPRIFEPEQIRRIVEQAGTLGPADSIRPFTYQTLFGLLASCGLRISEALTLQVEDVTTDGLIIRHTKFRKTRLVPMHETTERAMQDYLRRRRAVAGATTHCFVSMHGKPLCYPTVNRTFRTILCELGLRAGAGASGARLHDLRHTLAVRALEHSPHEHVANHMLALSTYLGHSKVTHTYWYLHVTPHLLAGIADACRAQIEGGAP